MRPMSHFRRHFLRNKRFRVAECQIKACFSKYALPTLPTKDAQLNKQRNILFSDWPYLKYSFAVESIHLPHSVFFQWWNLGLQRMSREQKPLKYCVTIPEHWFPPPTRCHWCPRAHRKSHRKFSDRSATCALSRSRIVFEFEIIESMVSFKIYNFEMLLWTLLVLGKKAGFGS